MRLLLDTHAALWALSGPEALSATVKEVIAGADEIRLSVVSSWEIVIKVALGELTLSGASRLSAESLSASSGLDCWPSTSRMCWRWAASHRTMGTPLTGSSSRRPGLKG